MSYQREDYKNLFKTNLEPFLDMLGYERPKLNPHHWLERVSRLATSVAGNPEQYVGPVMPLKSVTAEIVEEIFEDFVREHSLLEESALHA